MKAMKRVEALFKKNGLVFGHYTSIEDIPLYFKFEIIEDLLKHIDDNGTGFPTYKSLDLRNKVMNLIQSYGGVVSSFPGGWLQFINLSRTIADLILQEYAESKEGKK